MRTVCMEKMRPEEIVAAREACPIAYISCGPLEWHGLGLPYGTDPLVAHAWAVAAAEKLGGVVFPPVFFGTERERPSYILKNKGFEDYENLYVKGMDVPKNLIPSCYAREDIFALIMRENLRMLVELGYKAIVIVNGHGAWGQVSTLQRLAVEFSNETNCKVMYCLPNPTVEMPELDFGHGTLVEASFVRYICDENVDMSAYPPREVPLNYTDWGIADDMVFAEDYGKIGGTIQYDPRDASVEFGEKVFNAAVNDLTKKVEELIKTL